MSNVNSLAYEPRRGCAVKDSLVLQNWSSSAESAHAITEASVTGHRLYSDGKRRAN